MNQELARIFSELAVLYEIKGVAFKPRAFERVAEGIAGLGTDVKQRYEDGGLEALERIPGVGKGIAERIEEYIETGTIAEYDRMKKKLPVDIVGLTTIGGIGPKTLVQLYQKLHIKNRKQLEQAARAGKLSKIRSIGKKGEERILRALGSDQESEGRVIPALVWPAIKGMLDELATVAGVKSIEPVGSLRRMQETIGDLDILAITNNPERILTAFVDLPQVASVHNHGEVRASVRLHIGIDADLFVLPAESYGAARIAWTGNQAHNIKLRARAKEKGLLLDEYGVFKKKKLIASRTEESVYRALGLPWIPPELRSDTGEIEAAEEGTLPKVVGYDQLRGDLQVQTDWSDGEHSILQMAKAAEALGLEYIAITDHTQSLKIANGLDEKRIKQQWAEIDRVQKRVPKIKILKGSECDIRKDGSLDLPDAVLAELDVVGGSVHTSMQLSEKAQTERITRAMENEHLDILFHPTGRRIGRRPPYPVDIKAIIQTAQKTKTVLEIDAAPERQDLRDAHIRMAREAGVKFAIDSDAHAAEQFSYLRWGIGLARRGWATKQEVINTKSWQSMLRALK